MEKDLKIYNGMVVFDEPIEFVDGESVYGFLFNNESEEDRERIPAYLAYITGISELLKNGVPLENEKGWSFPQEKLTVNCDTNTLASFIGIFLRDKVGFKTLSFDDPVIWEKGEISEYSHYFIIRPSLIKRYTHTNK